MMYNMELDVEYYDMCIYMLEKERMKITQRGRLSNEEDRRLDEIDAEIEYWIESIEETLNPYGYDE